jgi:ketosteroid isomerase-like protein
MNRGAYLFLLLAVGCSRSEPPADMIVAAKDVMRSHEEFAAAGDLEGVLSNAADDIVLLTPGVELVEGKESFRDFYQGLLALGSWQFDHDYSGAEVVGDAVVLHGVARGTLTPPEGGPSSFANNFILILRSQPDRSLRVWRVAFAPAGAG